MTMRRGIPAAATAADSIAATEPVTAKREAFFQHPGVVPGLALLCCALWGSAFPCIKIGYRLLDIQGAGSQILFAGYRFFLAGALTFVLSSLLERRVVRLRRDSVPAVFGQGLLQTTVQYVFFYLGLAHTSGAKGSVLNASSTFFAILIAHFLIKGERITWRKAAGCLVGFAGVVVVNLAPGSWGGGFAWNGEGFILLCSLAYGASSVTLKLITRRESASAVTAYQLLFGGGVLVVIGLLAGGRVTGFTVQSVLLLVYLALLSTVAFSLWAALLSCNPVGRVSVYGFSIPVFGVGLSALLLGEEAASWNSLLALALVAAGIALVNTNGKKN